MIRSILNRAVAITAAVLLAGWSAGAVAALDQAIRQALEAASADPVGRVVREQWSTRGDVPRFVHPIAPFRATAFARDVLDVLADASSRGLDAATYGVDALRAALELPHDAAAAARFEAALALAWGRFLADAGYGRVDPKLLGHDLPRWRGRDTLPTALRTALAAPSAAEALDSIEPAWPAYRALRDGLADWRRRPTLPPPRPLPRPGPPGTVSPGDAWPGVSELRERLRREGDLGEADAAAAGWQAVQEGRYVGELVDAVRRFQARHGLAVDGVIGPRTFAALDVPTADRVRQIERSLERLRWLGPLPQGRFVAVNIPEFRLWAVDSGRVVASMAVVVGRAASPTPVFVDTIEAVELNPFWNVPPSIASRELYPKFARDPGWLAAEGMTLIGAEAVAPGDLRHALATGRARLRQSPGERNALGRVKLVMPNAHHVYLHDTPAQALFAHSRRDFSHGCIRVERPRELASFVLAGRPEESLEWIGKAIATGRTHRVRPVAPIPVLIFYSTVGVGEDGRLRFLPDVYGHDARFDAALARRRPAIDPRAGACLGIDAWAG